MSTTETDLVTELVNPIPETTKDTGQRTTMSTR
jgi:hypothetical protein